ncbi:membrane protein [Mangrovimonas yunxiaonensis]|uniref:Membrane protein n=1 Tax=Mangrovimonas yunxiaonensis TaxID=1197477 RepID=A0A084TJ68_9FLAO|nr:O-antigen ligase family protein [Mangrovimonas yunxiaonensis]KFB00754.1 membrane protein [Mangrovimonas yunxiaonensis]GGH45906.1 ligase [Mangrovimonas yunxiaonensis]
MRVTFRDYNADNYLTLILLHIGMGLALYAIPVVGKLIFVGAFLYFFLKIVMVPKKEKTRAVLLGCAYFVGAEVLFRMTKSGLSYEASKYIVILFTLMGIFYRGVSGKGHPYFMYLILLVPAIVVASITLTFDARFRTNIAFVLSGPVCLGIAALFCYDRKVSQSLLLEVLNYMVLPIIATTCYLFLYTPSIKDVLSSTASNSAASGGFGPNQVSTILGLGMFAMVVRIFLRSPGTVLKVLNLVVFGAMTYRAFVTFSRGGVIAAVIVVAAFLWVLFWRSNARQKNQIVGSFALFVVAAAVTWMISSQQTMGLLDKRYANEDALGREKEDVATGRLDLFMEEMEGFLGHPFFGVGASRTKNMRVEAGIGHLPSHNEIGRLLSEHGIMGILILLILIFTPLAYRTTNNRNLFFYAFLAFWFATINHSGMRIAAPSFVYALALLNVTYAKKHPVHRKQIK